MLGCLKTSDRNGLILTLFAGLAIFRMIYT